MNTLKGKGFFQNDFYIVTALGILDVLVVTLVSFVTTLYNKGVDADIYAHQILQFRSNSSISSLDVASNFRFFKPFYGVVGSWFFNVDPYTTILCINLSFFVGITIAAYFFLRGLKFSKQYAFIGTLWIIAAYPMLKYGLALSTDISGWFFSLVTIAVALRAFAKDSPRLLLLASLLGFLGSLTKETGPLGLIFAGVFILIQFGNWKIPKIVHYLAYLCIPFFILEILFLLILHFAGAPTLAEWYAYNRSTYSHGYYTLPMFLGVESSTFNVLGLFALIGLVRGIITRSLLSRENIAIYVGLFVATLPVLLWPLFISRILFIEFLIVVPLALFGLVYLSSFMQEAKRIPSLVRRMEIGVVTSLPVIVSVLLYCLSGAGSLFRFFS